MNTDKTNVEKFGIVEDLTVLEVVPLGITKALSEIVLDSKEGLVFTRVELRLDLVEGDGFLNDSVIVRVHALVGETEKVD